MGLAFVFGGDLLLYVVVPSPHVGARRLPLPGGGPACLRGRGGEPLFCLLLLLLLFVDCAN